MATGLIYLFSYLRDCTELAATTVTGRSAHNFGPPHQPRMCRRPFLMSAVRSMKRPATVVAAQQVMKRGRLDDSKPHSAPPASRSNPGLSDLGQGAYVNYSPRAFSQSDSTGLFQQLQASHQRSLGCGLLQPGAPCAVRKPCRLGLL